MTLYDAQVLNVALLFTTLVLLIAFCVAGYHVEKYYNLLTEYRSILRQIRNKAANSKEAAQGSDLFAVSEIAANALIEMSNP